MLQDVIYMFFVFLLNFVHVNAKDGDGWQKISNMFYSLEVPSDWKPCDGSPEMIPGERDARGFKIRYLSWWRPVTYKEWNKTMGFDIQSYGRLDGSPVSILEIENLTFINVRKEIIVDSKTEKVLFCLEEE